VQCVEFEGLLAEALDATLHGASLAAFEAHQKSCPACAAMYQEAAAGMHWLKGLEDLDPPKHLVHNILAQTIGTVAVTSTKAAPAGESWLDRLKARISPVFAPVVTPRFAMSFGMAFFSITMLANIAGLHVSESRVRDLRRSATPDKQEEPSTPSNPKKGATPEQDRKYQNYSREANQPVLASCPAVEEQVIPQARLNWRNI